MKKTILAAVPLALLALAVPSAAQAKRAVTYKAKLAPSAESAVRGKAQLVDGKRRDKVRLRVKGLGAGATYGWALRKAPAGGDACTGDEVGSFTYAALHGRRGGSAKARARGKAFAGGDGVYAVVVTDAAGEDVACLALKSKAQRKAERKRAEQRQDAGDDDGSSLDDDELGDDDEQLDDGSEDLGDDEPVEDEPAEDEPLDDDADDLL